MKNKVIEMIKEIMEENGIDTEITLDSKLKDDLGLDSFSLALLTVKIEDEFDVDIFEDSFPQTLSEIMEILKR